MRAIFILLLVELTACKARVSMESRPAGEQAPPASSTTTDKAFFGARFVQFHDHEHGLVCWGAIASGMQGAGVSCFADTVHPAGGKGEK